MQFGFGTGPDTSWMRKELTDLGIEELKTVEDVDRAMKEYNEGTMLMVINSVCGCVIETSKPRANPRIRSFDDGEPARRWRSAENGSERLCNPFGFEERVFYQNQR